MKCFIYYFIFQLLKDGNYEFDVAFTSVLKRSVKTLFLIQEELDNHWLPVFKSWRLNERHYGALQGLNKSETAAKYGEDQVQVSSSVFCACNTEQISSICNKKWLNTINFVN